MNGREGTWTGTDAVEDPKANSEQFHVMVVVVVVGGGWWYSNNKA